MLIYCKRKVKVKYRFGRFSQQVHKERKNFEDSLPNIIALLLIHRFCHCWIPNLLLRSTACSICRGRCAGRTWVGPVGPGTYPSPPSPASLSLSFFLIRSALSPSLSSLPFFSPVDLATALLAKHREVERIRAVSAPEFLRASSALDWAGRRRRRGRRRRGRLREAARCDAARSHGDALPGAEVVRRGPPPELVLDGGGELSG